MILVLTGRSGYINDLHHWATHRVCWHWPDLHRPQIFECQGSCSRFDEVIHDLVHQPIFLTCYSPAFKLAKRARKCLSFLLKKPVLSIFREGLPFCHDKITRNQQWEFYTDFDWINKYYGFKHVIFIYKTNLFVQN